MTIESNNMFRPDGTRVQLIDWLNGIEPNNLNWSVLDFNGIGQAPNDLSMDEFEDAIRSDSTGFKMSWDELIVFAQSLEQTIECLIIALDPNVEFVGEDLAKDDFSSCEIIIQAFDSTEWRAKKN
ncbi:hypothetical protein ORJ00_05275 [Rheinheimera baltica]|uniref:hypothetical protein n=1 Tax=Rheinheimera baltica TaxID=67576 RepID=UPI00273E1D99|nr:hypothetical protein [Rheinheimera baltica]MDP5142144.1 hypothetical protein [Rheinheimera baltica]